MFTGAIPPAPAPVAREPRTPSPTFGGRQRTRVVFEPSERIGLWVVGPERDDQGHRARLCYCDCGGRRIIRTARLAEMRRLGLPGGCAACAGPRKGRSQTKAAEVAARADRALAKLTTERRISGAETNLRDLEERSPFDSRAARAALELLHRDLRESGRGQQAAWVHAVLRLADYALAGGR